MAKEGIRLLSDEYRKDTLILLMVSYMSFMGHLFKVNSIRLWYLELTTFITVGLISVWKLIC